MGIDNKPAADLATGEMMKSAEGWIEVKAGEEARVNWVVDVTQDGKADVQMTAQTDEEADAVKMNFPILVHGVQRFASQSGVLKDGQTSSRCHYQSAQRTALWTKRFKRATQSEHRRDDDGRAAVSGRLSVWLRRANHVALFANGRWCKKRCPIAA